MMRKEKTKSSLFWAEEGFSTVGMAIALLLTLALIFTAARVYEVNTASAQVQEVADAAALAAENTVGEFYIAASVCDAVALSLSLTMVCSLGLGVVCACIPPTEGLSKAFIDAAKKMKESRDSFCESAEESLTKIAEALPFLATVKAQEVFAANSISGASYQGIAILQPWEMEKGNEPSFDESDETLTEVDEHQEELRENARKAEEAAERANEWKQHAYEHDSGSQDSYCMYERAAKLAGMSGLQNPFFSTVDTWNFSAALERAKVYYQTRYQKEVPLGSSVDEQANSALRKRFYAYAQAEVGKGYVRETEGSFDALFPLLPKNTDEMRGTTLYLDAVYPKTVDASGVMVMHAWEGCPGAAQGSYLGLGCIREMDGVSGYAPCPYCQFSPSSMGRVAAASSSIENGFEYHYNEVAKAAAEYQKARAELDPMSAKVKEQAEGLLSSVRDALAQACANRIDITPPGHYGAVVLVVDTAAPASRFPSSFVASEGSAALGPRVALSCATLVRESSDEGSNVITSFLDGVSADGSVLVGSMGHVLKLWSGLLGVYTQGHDAMGDAVKQAIDSIPLASASGLGSWASEKLQDMVSDVGFSPPDLRARKAVLVNSSHVLEADGSSFSATLLSAKDQAVSLEGSVGINGALSSLESAALQSIEDLGGEYTIATIVLLDGVVEIPITVALPSSVTGSLEQAVRDGIGYLKGVVASLTGVRQWE